MKRIVHLTSVHERGDTRILLKQCASLASSGHEVFLIVADGKGEETRLGVRILDVGTSRGRLGRMLGTTRRIAARARDLRADLYHIHDPELLPAGLLLKRSGARVVFDAHEDLPRQILSKPYIAPLARRPVAAATDHFERFACRRLDAVVAATPTIRERFARLGIACVDVNNYPLSGELEAGIAWSGKAAQICYVGGITAIRGIRETVEAMALCKSDARLSLVGTFAEPDIHAELGRRRGWARIDELGFLARPAVRAEMGRCVAGLVTFLPVPNHIEAQPTKLFEYMSAGLAVIASDFPLWREIVLGNECGLCVDPRDPAAIARAIDLLVLDPETARRMGENGSRAVATRYNWASEEKKLLALYDKLLPRA